VVELVVISRPRGLAPASLEGWGEACGSTPAASERGAAGPGSPQPLPGQVLEGPEAPGATSPGGSGEGPRAGERPRCGGGPPSSERLELGPACVWHCGPDRPASPRRPAGHAFCEVEALPGRPALGSAATGALPPERCGTARGPAVAPASAPALAPALAPGAAQVGKDAAGGRAALASRASALRAGVASCWEGLQISGRVVVGCAFALAAVGEVLYSVLLEAVRGEEPIEVTLARGSPSSKSLASIPEEEEDQ